MISNQMVTIINTIVNRLINDFFSNSFPDNTIYCIIQRTPSKMARDDEDHPVSFFHLISYHEIKIMLCLLFV